MLMRCAKCNAPAVSGSKYCQRCKKEIETAADDFLISLLTMPASEAQMRKMRNDPTVKKILKEMKGSRKDAEQKPEMPSIDEIDSGCRIQNDDSKKSRRGFFGRIFGW